MSDSQDDPSAVEQDPTLRFDVDGEQVAATRYEPTGFDGPLPAVLWYTPYHKDDETTFGRYDPLLEYVAASGYEVVVADVVGTGASTGHREELIGSNVARQAAGVVEAVADRPWTTDRAGMLGKSFPGALCLAAAAEDPDPLAAIVPILTPYRREGFPFGHGGLPDLWMTTTMVAVDTATAVQPPSRRPPGWEETWRARLDRYRAAGPPLAPALDPDPDDPYWDWGVPVEEIEVPTFAVGGYRDHFPGETVAYFSAIDAPKRLLMGPWRHVVPYRGHDTAVGFRGQVVDWFDRFLKDEPVDPFEQPVAFWTERDGGRQVGEGTWRGRTTWPGVDGADPGTLSFAVTPEGLGRTETFDSGTVERTHEVDPTVGLEAHNLAGPLVDTNADDARATTFETAPLDHPVELTGTGQATVQVTVDGPIPVCIRLVDATPDGRARPVTRGGALVDEVGDDSVSVPLAPVSHVFEEGHRLRVAIGAADFPSHVPLATEEAFVVTSSPTAPTTIRVPGRDPAPRMFEDVVSMPPPDDTFSPVPAAIEAADLSHETTREHVRGMARRRRHAATDFAFPHVEKTYELDVEASVATDDPGTFSARATVETALDHDDDPVTVETTVHRDPEGATVEATVWLDGDPAFEEEWSV